MLNNGDLIVPANTGRNIGEALIYECVARNHYGIDAKIVMFYAAGV
jgi:hypothetical protein